MLGLLHFMTHKIICQISQIIVTQIKLLAHSKDMENKKSQKYRLIFGM